MDAPILDKEQRTTSELEDIAGSVDRFPVARVTTAVSILQRLQTQKLHLSFRVLRHNWAKFRAAYLIKTRLEQQFDYFAGATIF